MNWLNALGSVSQDRVFVVRNGVWDHEGDALEIGVWWEEKVERWKRRFTVTRIWTIFAIWRFYFYLAPLLLRLLKRTHVC